MVRHGWFANVSDLHGSARWATARDLRAARLAADAERYYRVMYYGSVDSWNLRDQHMFDTLERLFEFHGSGSKGIVWAHNSHIGNAAATEMGARGEYNI